MIIMKKAHPKLGDHHDQLPAGRSSAKAPMLSTIVFAAVIFVLYLNSIVCNVQLQSSVLKGQGDVNPDLLRIGTSKKLMISPDLLRIGTSKKLMIRSAVTVLPLHSVQEESKEAHHQISLIPPWNFTEKQRIRWFRKKLPEFEILKSTELSRKFHGRVLEFFNNGCDVQFFMTWISPASSFGARELLAVESVFKSNPNGCLVILSRTMDSVQGYKILKPLIDRKLRVSAITPDLGFLFNNTPAESWFNEMKSGNKDPGQIPLPQNLSNLIRLAVLYRYGGVYLDTDFIVLKSFKGLRNSIGAQSMDASFKNWTRLNNAVLVFDVNHPILLKFIEEFASTFDGSKWGHNGPYLVSRVVHRVAGTPGYDLTVLPPMAFYPVGWIKIGSFFKKPESEACSKWVDAKIRQLSGETFGVHLWNKKSNGFGIEEGSLMERLISTHCVICQYDTIAPKS